VEVATSNAHARTGYAVVACYEVFELDMPEMTGIAGSQGLTVQILVRVEWGGQ